LKQNRRSASYFDAFSSREPVSTPHQVRGKLLLENATSRAPERVENQSPIALII
jgi:hypothetical protein